MLVLFSVPFRFPVKEKASEAHDIASRNKGVLSPLAFLLWLGQARGKNFPLSSYGSCEKGSVWSREGSPQCVDRHQQLAGCSTGLAGLLINYKWFMMSFWAWRDRHGVRPEHMPPAPFRGYLARISCYSGSIWERKLCVNKSLMFSLGRERRS